MYWYETHRNKHASVDFSLQCSTLVNVPKMLYMLYKAAYDAGVLGPSNTAFPLLTVAYFTAPTELS